MVNFLQSLILSSSKFLTRRDINERGLQTEGVEGAVTMFTHDQLCSVIVILVADGTSFATITKPRVRAHFEGHDGVQLLQTTRVMVIFAIGTAKRRVKQEKVQLRWFGNNRE